MRIQILKELKTLEKLFPEINYNYKVNFNLNSKIIMGEYNPNKDIIYFNLKVFEKIGFEEYKKVIVHEFSHLVTIYKYGINIQDHGKDWKRIMKELGANELSAKIDFSFLLDENKNMECNCSQYKFTRNRLTRFNNGREYKCKSCGVKVRPNKLHRGKPTMFSSDSN